MLMLLSLEILTVDPMIKNPERYLDDPKNIHFETNVKNRLYELVRTATSCPHILLLFLT